MYIKNRGFLIVICLLLLEPTKAQDEAADSQPDTIQPIPGTTIFASHCLRSLPFRNTASFVLNAPGSYYLKDQGYFIDGIEANSDYIFIDGMQVTDAEDFPYRAVGKVKNYRLNQPIHWGNVAGGMLEIETIRNRDSLVFEADFLTTLEKGYSNQIVELFATGPVTFRRKDKRKWQFIPSFIFGANANIFNDPSPGWEDKFKATESFQNFIAQTPYKENTMFDYGTVANADFALPENFESVKFHPDAKRKQKNFYGKLIFPINSRITLSAGTYIKIDRGQEFVFENSLFNSHNNPETVNRNFDNFLNWNHNILKGDDISLDYQLNLQYSYYHFERYHEDFEDNWFEYGYLGKYQTYKMPTFELGEIVIDSVIYQNVMLLNSWDYDTTITFQDLGYNSEAARYTEMIYEIYPDKGDINNVIGYWRNETDLISNGGLLNGYSPENIYDLWNAHGDLSLATNYNTLAWNDNHYGEEISEKFRGNLQVNFNIHEHRLTFGVEHKRMPHRSFKIIPDRLWRQMQNGLNNQLLELDLENPKLINDTVYFSRKFNPDEQFIFDKNLRRKLGLTADGLEYILIDSYDPVNHTIDYYDSEGSLHTISTPENLLRLSLFDPGNLVFNNVLKYKGFDHEGNIYRETNNAYSFYEDSSSEAFNPSYTALFVQDEFKVSDFSARVGLRVDFYNAKQPVLSDKYTFYDAFRKDEVTSIAGNPAEHPSNIGNEYVVYVDNVYNPTAITGYRNGDIWYDASGNEVSDPYLLNTGSGVIPYIKEPGIEIGDPAWKPDMTFSDYETVINFLPQINLTYFIRGLNVYANYNSFTRNPSFMNQFNPEDYLMVSSIFVLNNPAQKPFRMDKINLGAGIRIYGDLFADLSFQKQIITDYPAFISTVQAYPLPYLTLRNSKETYEINSATGQLLYNSIKKTGWCGNLSYTLYNISDQADAIFKLPTFVFNTGLSYNFGYSGAFQYESNNVLKSVFKGLIIGLYNQTRSGTRLPEFPGIDNTHDRSPNFSFFNLRIEKGIYFEKATTYLGFYLWIENLFNQQNVYYVNPKTGKVDDDGFLNDPENQFFIESQNSPEAYRMYYNMKLKDPSHYAKPRIIRFGLVLNL